MKVLALPSRKIIVGKIDQTARCRIIQLHTLDYHHEWKNYSVFQGQR
jgi:hypothetical protein